MAGVEGRRVLSECGERGGVDGSISSLAAMLASASASISSLDFVSDTDNGRESARSLPSLAW